ncbi:MAG: nucleoside deaminase [Bacillales bacterium]|nr:nucleoside deaminase [Bacillales bacterium]
MKKTPEEYMRLALDEAELAYQENEVPIGAIVVLNDEVIGRGHNKRESTSLVTSHAEIEAIKEASKKIGSWKLDNAEIYVTIEPCPMCSYAIIDSHMKKLYYGAKDLKRGAVSKLDIFNQNLGKKVLVCGNILEEESREIMERFFKDLRKK